MHTRKNNRPERDPEAQPDWAQPRPDFEAKNAARRRAKQEQKRGGRHPRPKSKPQTAGKGPRKGAYKMIKQPGRRTDESPEQHKARLKSNAERFGKLARGQG